MKKIQENTIRIDLINRKIGVPSIIATVLLGLASSPLVFAAPESKSSLPAQISTSAPAAASSSAAPKPQNAQSKKTERETKAPSASDLKYEGSGAIIGSTKPFDGSLKSRISGYASMQYSVKAYETQTKRDRDSFAYTLGMGYKLNPDYSLGVSASIYNNSDELERREQLKLSSVAVSASRNAFRLPRNYTLRPSLSVRLPVGRDTTERESLLMGINPSASLGLPVADWTGLGKLSSSVQLSTFWNIHEYRQTASGASNNQYGYTSAVRVGYSLPKDFSISGSIAYNSAWTYRQTQVESLGHSESLSWAFMENASASLGHSNRGPLFAYAGVNYDYSLLSERSSYFFGELTASF